ncbi:MAG: heme-binding protein [Alphaproteobacteria bacterium]|nr:heme-binding protein [Alphaproteobacteria bacterium]
MVEVYKDRELHVAVFEGTWEFYRCCRVVVSRQHPQKNIPLAMAQDIANAALTKCESMGFKVSVVVVDRGGLPIVMLRGDGSGLHTPEGADRKAYTARTFSQPSAAFTKRMLDNPNSVGSRHYTRVLALPGGLPIKAGDDVVGAVGVSGSPGKDDVCSQAGIDKVADQLH